MHLQTTNYKASLNYKLQNVHNKININLRKSGKFSGSIDCVYLSVSMN